MGLGRCALHNLNKKIKKENFRKKNIEEWESKIQLLSAVASNIPTRYINIRDICEKFNGSMNLLLPQNKHCLAEEPRRSRFK